MTRSLTRHRVLRSWPWTIALAAVVVAVLLVGMAGFSLRSSWVGLLFSLVVIAVALAALFRVLTSGVYLLPTGLMIRELTKTTPVPWVRIRSITTAPTGRRGVHAPVLVIQPAPGAGKSAPQRIEVILLASYHESVAQRRAQELIAAKEAATNTSAGSSAAGSRRAKPGRRGRTGPA